ncbi:MAG: neutral/alkaline non-lysosomal ceramidase N-terminal domain-containing protein [Terriglobia bacterium]
MCAWKRVVALAFLALLTAGWLPAESLKAGAAEVDITPPVGVPLWGYELRESTGTLDPLYARVLVLEVGDQRLALVTLDLGRTFGRDSIDRLRAAAKASSGISYVFVAATHDHSAPSLQDKYRNGTPAWETAMLDKIGKAIAEAHESAVEARLGMGYGVAYIGHNRHRLNADGTVTWFEHNPTEVPTAPVDPTVAVLRVDTLEGKPLAVLVNYACHPVVFGPDNTQYSADYVGVMEKAVEQAVGGHAICFFLQGAAGDINPYYAVVPLKEDAIKRRDWTGQRLGEEAARVAVGIHTQAAEKPSLDFAEDLLPFHFRYSVAKYKQAIMGSSEIDAGGLEAYMPSTDPVQQLPVAALLINKKIAVLGMPGEPFVDFQMNWRSRCPVEDCLLAGYSNGYFGYLPTIKAASEGGYGAASAATWIEPGAGEIMVDHALVKVYQMLGLLIDAPEDPKEDYTVTHRRAAP